MDEFGLLSQAAVKRLREERDVMKKILQSVEQSITFATEEEATASGYGLRDDVAWAVYWANRGDFARALSSLEGGAKDK